MTRSKLYYIIASDLTIRMKEWKKDAEDKANFHCGNRFRTRAEAEAKVKDFRRMRGER